MKKEIEILMNDNCTRNEAVKHIQQGTAIYSMDEKKDFIQNCIGGLMEEGEALQAWEDLVEVNYQGTTYKIDYVL